MNAPIDTCILLDVVCQHLAIARDRVALPLARAAEAVMNGSSWQVLGYARASDFTAEVLGRSKRWFSDLLALNRAVTHFPILEEALCGDDGQRRIGRCAALCIGRIASDESVHAWIDFARSHTVRQLRQEISEARARNSAWPAAAGPAATPKSGGRSGTDASAVVDTTSAAQSARRPSDASDTDSPDDVRVSVRVAVPAAVLAAFEETLDLHRAVVGRDASVTQFVEALSAESSSGLPPEDEADARAMRHGRERRTLEEALARATRLWKHLHDITDPSARPGPSARSGPNAWPVPSARSGPNAWPVPSTRSGPSAQSLLNASSSSDTWLALSACSDTCPAGPSAGEDDGGPSVQPAVSLTAKAMREALDVLSELDELATRVGQGDAVQHIEHMIALMEMEERLEIVVGLVLAAIAQNRGWRELKFSGVGHYGVERLGVSRTTAEDRAGLACWLRTRPRIREAYEKGKLGLEAALLLRRVLARAGASPKLEEAWLAHAMQVTVKRLRSEARLALQRQLVGARAQRVEAPEVPELPDLSTVSLGLGAVNTALPTVPAGKSAPLAPVEEPLVSFPVDDRTWHDGNQRHYGDTSRRVIRLGALAIEIPIPDVFLRLRLPDEIARNLMGALESKRRVMATEAERDTWDCAWDAPPWETAPRAGALGIHMGAHGLGPDSGVYPPSWLAARMFASRGRRVPTWVALLALLEEYAHTWDEPGAVPRRAADAVYIRAGWRCTAPGCTSRQNLEDHHIVYRSRGGGNELANRTCVCRFHHQRGEHGGLAQVRGEAPYNLVWRLGRPDVARWYHNERLVPLPPGRSALDPFAEIRQVAGLEHDRGAEPLRSGSRPVGRGTSTIG